MPHIQTFIVTKIPNNSDRSHTPDGMSHCGEGHMTAAKLSFCHDSIWARGRVYSPE